MIDQITDNSIIGSKDFTAFQEFQAVKFTLTIKRLQQTILPNEIDKIYIAGAALTWIRPESVLRETARIFFLFDAIRSGCSPPNNIFLASKSYLLLAILRNKALQRQVGHSFQQARRWRNSFAHCSRLFRPK